MQEALVLVSIVLTGSADDAVPPRFPAELRQWVDERVSKERVPSLAVVASRKGIVVFEHAVGWADVESKRPATTDVMYCLGSVSKPITATGLMTLVERGMISLDAPANAYLGDAKLRAFTGESDRATVRRLADHSSGLARHDLYAEAGGGPILVDDRIRKFGFLLRPPGEAYEYSNLGYMVLARIIERRSGRSFADFMKDEVFLPLGMKDSMIGVDPARSSEAAACYGPDRKRLPNQFRPVEAPAHGGIYASVKDLHRFGSFHLGGKTPEPRFLRADSVELMHQPSVRTGPSSWYGIGWRTEEGAEFGHRAILHTGQTDGATAVLMLIPDQGLCVAAVTNSPHSLPWEAAVEIVKRIAPAARTATQPLKGSEAFGRRDYKPTNECVGHWRGSVETYERKLPVEVEFTGAGPIVIRLDDQPKATLGGVRIEDGYLRGSFDGDLKLPELHGKPGRLHLKVRLRSGGVIDGSITAVSARGQPTLTLSQWISVRRVDSK